MKNLIAIPFLFIFLFANTEIGQLLKLPVLLHHYLEHHDEEASISFTDFLHKHYTEENSHSSPNKEHQRLPFKSHDCCMANIPIAYCVPAAFSLKAEIPFSAKKEIFVFNVAFNLPSYFFRIWQPPKSC